MLDESDWVVKSMRLDPITSKMREKLKAIEDMTDNQLEFLMITAVIYARKKGADFNRPKDKSMKIESYKELMMIYNSVK
jgi:hypothetical protein